MVRFSKESTGRFPCHRWYFHILEMATYGVQFLGPIAWMILFKLPWWHHSTYETIEIQMERHSQSISISPFQGRFWTMTTLVVGENPLKRHRPSTKRDWPIWKINEETVDVTMGVSAESTEVVEGLPTSQDPPLDCLVLCGGRVIFLTCVSTWAMETKCWFIFGKGTYSLVELGLL